MPKEIERKFMWKEDRTMPKNSLVKVINMEQGYIAQSDNCVVRVRTSFDEHYNNGLKVSDYVANLTIKSRNAGKSRDEFEYEIPMEHANELLQTTEHIIKKSRFIYMIDGHKFECDVFDGKHEGLEMAEIEFVTEEAAEAFDPSLYPFLGKEVSDDVEYSNHNLAMWE